MAKKLFVGSLPWSVNDDQLRAHFEKIGEVSSATVVMDKFAENRSRGFGFVEMPNDDEAMKAIKELDGKELDGREITVSEAKPREDKPRGGGGDRRFGNDFGSRDNSHRDKPSHDKPAPEAVEEAGSEDGEEKAAA